MPTVAENFDHNFRVLTTLANTPDLHLVYELGTFSTESANESLAPDPGDYEKAVEPIKALFAEAKARLISGEMTPADFDQAERGLVMLRRTYQGASRMDIAGVIDGIRREIDAVPPSFRGFGEFVYSKYERFLITSIYQGEYYPVGHPGVCKGLCMDWICRKVHPARNKAWYRVSKKPSPTGAPPARPDPDWMRARMTKKVANRIGALQEVGLAEMGAGKLAERYSDLTEDYFWRSGKDPARYYEKLWVECIATGPRGYVVDLARPPHPDEGRRIFLEVLQRCQPREQGPTVKYLRDRGLHEAGVAEADRRYDAYIKRCVDSMPFLLSIGPPTGTGHAVALCSVRFGWHFFDPNFGEFEFPTAAYDQFLDFLGRLWLYYRSAFRFSRFEIDHVYYSEELVP